MLNNATIAKMRSSSGKTVKRWRDKALSLFNSWIKNPPKEEEDAKNEILNMLEDKPRSGAPPKFSTVNVCLILSVALEKPEDCGRPISFWSTRELADEVVLRGIVENISKSTIGNILRAAIVRPHKSQYWLNPNIECKEEFKKNIDDVCDLYRDSKKLALKNTKLVSIDEKTGMQAISRCSPDKPMMLNSDVKIEFEYKRNGTQCLTPTFDILTGKIIAYQIREKRTEPDFVEHIMETVETSPDSNWIFVMDQLNTHKSEGLVKYFAKINGYSGDLGIKGEKGILKSMSSREEFLTKKDGKLRIQYTPKHCSWMNQIEVWLGIFDRKALRRASFESVELLVKRTEDFIEYYNETMAKPFKWLYAGKKRLFQFEN
jgi:hypothetical protein